MMKKKIKWLLLCGLLAMGLMGLGLFLVIHQYSTSSIQAFSSKDHLTAKIPKAVLLWSEDGTVTGTALSSWQPVSITKGENPRWSPDGTRFIFTHKNDVWLMSSDLKSKKRILKNIVTESGTGAYWTNDGKRVIAIKKDNAQQVILKDIATGKITLYHDDGEPPFKGYRFTQCAEIRLGGRYLLTFTRDEGHRSVIIDLEKKQYIYNELMLKGDCAPAWSQDGSFIVMTRRNRKSMNRPIFVTRFNPKTRKVTPSEYLIGRGRCSNASISNDSKYVLYVTSGNIFIWHINVETNGEQHGIQLTHTKKSDGPNLYIFKRHVPAAFN